MPVDRSGPGAFDPIPFAHPEALTDPEKLLAAYFSSSTIGLCILDSELRYLAINDTLAGINGIPAADHVGKTVREVLGNFADHVEPAFQRVLTTRESVNFELSATLPQEANLAIGLRTTSPFRIRAEWSSESPRRWSRLLSKRNWNSRSKPLAENWAKRGTGCRCYWT
jgi:PAS domain-containing protein